MNQEGFDTLLDAIYGAAVAPGRWVDTLALLSRPFGAHNVGHVVSNPDRSNVHGFVFGMDAAVHTTFLRRWHRTNPVARRAVEVGSAVVRGSTALPTDQLLRTPMYEEYFAPCDILFGLRLSLRQNKVGSSTISIMRSPRAGDYDTADLVLAKRLLPHLRRADHIRTALQEADLSTRAAWTALDNLPQPMLVLDSDRRVLRTNLQGARLLAAGDGLWSWGGQLQVDPTDQGALEVLLACAVPRDGQGAQAGSLRVRRPGGPPLILVAMPLSATALPGPVWDLPVRPAAILCLSNPTRGSKLPTELLRDLFGLTMAEAAVAQALLEGETIEAIATRSGRSLSTVRTHVARLLSKTGLTRQVDLTRLLATLPIWRPKQ